MRVSCIMASSRGGRGFKASSVCVRALQESAAFLAGRERHRRAEHDAAEQRHRQELALRQHARHVLDPARDEFDIGPGRGEVVEAGAERQQRLVGHVARAFGKDDQRMALVEHRQHDVDRVLRLVGPLRWISTERQHILGDEAAQPRLAPIVGGGDGMGAGALLLAAGRPTSRMKSPWLAWLAK